jgi:hypothetical protein
MIGIAPGPHLEAASTYGTGEWVVVVRTAVVGAVESLGLCVTSSSCQQKRDLVDCHGGGSGGEETTDG